MECKHIALALVSTLAFIDAAPAQQGSSQLLSPDQVPVVDPLEGNHSCAYAFDLVPGIYEGLAVHAAAPDYYRLRVPPDQTLHVDLNVREGSHDFTVAVLDECEGEPVLFSTHLIGTIPIELDNATDEPVSYVLRLYRDIGPLAVNAQIRYDLMIAEGDAGPYPDLCAGNGLTVNCPCANLEPVRGGCSHSGGRGALLVVGGSQFSELGGLTVHALDLPSQAPALLFSGELTGPELIMPFRDGILCFAGGSVVRHGTRTADAAGRADFSGDYDPRVDRLPGETVLLQVWFRDPAGPCGTGSNFTQAVRLEVKS